jgi:putative FmdB family regulatory protein
VPIYEYVCQSCQHRFEVKQGVADQPLSSCVRCGKAVTKVISAPAIVFKGTGWYVTDYSSKLKPNSESKAQEKVPPAEKKKEGDAAAAPAPAAGPEASASSSSAAGPANTPASAASGSSTSTNATPSSSKTRQR